MWLYVPGLTGSHSVPGLADLNLDSNEQFTVSETQSSQPKQNLRGES